MKALPLTASLRRCGARFGDITTVLLTVLLALGSDMSKQSPASTKIAIFTQWQSTEHAKVSHRGKDQLQEGHRQFW